MIIIDNNRNVICQTSEKNCKQPEVVTLGDGR